MISLYRPGTSVVHRMPAGAKLLVLAMCCIVVTVWESAVPVVALAVLCVAGYLASGLGAAELGRQLWHCRWIALFMVFAQIWFQTWQHTLLTTSRIVLLVVLAALVTATTKTEDTLDVIMWLCRPLERFGVSTERIGLMFALVIAAVPLVSANARAVGEAAASRGSRSIVAMASALVVMSLKQADDLADSLSARGF